MFIGVHKPNTNLGGNRGSSNDLMKYLSKEDIKNMDYITDEKLEELKNFFDQEDKDINIFDATKVIDENAKGLEKTDSKFYMLTINPSEKELDFLKEKSQQEYETLKKQAEKNGQSFNLEATDIFNNKMREYTHVVMDEYAKNFNRELNGKPLSKENLVYVAKIENERTYKYNDRYVKDNVEIKKEIRLLEKVKNSTKKIAELKDKLHKNSLGNVIKEGMKKEGSNEHIHVVVSRYDSTKAMKLSPLANSKGSDNHVLNGKKVQVGFDRVDFKIKSEMAFDKMFSYDRNKSNDMSTKEAIDNKSYTKSFLNKTGEIDIVNLAETVTKVVANPTEFVRGTIEQVKAIVIPEIDNNPIKEAKNAINIKKAVQEKIKSAFLTGGLEK